MKMATKQKKNRFSLELKYEIIKLIDKKNLFDVSLNKYQSEGIRIKNVYKIKFQRK
jgi:hypothetical protein